MKKYYLFSCLLLLAAVSSLAQPQTDYSSNGRLAERIGALTKTYPQWVTSRSIAKTNGGKDIWMLTIGSGKTETKQAIAVVGGVDGRHLLGTELAIGFAEKVLAASAIDSVKSILNTQTFYVFPNMSPDATEQYFGKLKYERSANASATDDDRDGKLGEDGFDDLNADGKITWMRVSDPTGRYKINPDDPRSLILADAAKGEAGKYLLFTEGIDNDKDGEFNEDADGGVAFNKNLSYNYRPFIPGAGEFAVSEKETRALLDLMFDQFNVYAVVTFGLANNLSSPVNSNPAGLAKRIITSWYEADAKANTLVSDKYNKVTGTKDAPRAQAETGDFSQWAYFHYGRLSFSTPGWWVPKVKPDTALKQKAFVNDDASAAYLRWAGSQKITDSYTEWKIIAHPDFPGQTVEVGGIDPFVMMNPPYKLVDGIAKKHTDFLLALAGMAPKLDLVGLKTEKVGEGLTRVTVKVMNTGTLPTLTRIGERSYFLKKVQLKLNLTGNQTIISGNKTQALEGIAGKDYKEFTWLVRGSGKITIEAASPSSGSRSIDVTL